MIDPKFCYFSTKSDPVTASKKQTVSSNKIFPSPVIKAYKQRHFAKEIETEFLEFPGRVIL